jgi:hypothetical protein
MKKIIRLTESDLVKLVKRVIKEQTVGNVAVIGQIVKELSKGGCAELNLQMRDVITKLILGTDYKTYQSKATWGEYFDLLQRTKKTLDSEINKIGKSNISLKIQQLSSGFNKDCVTKFQKELVDRAGLPNVLDTPDGGRIQFIDGIVGLTTLIAYVDGSIDFFTKVLETNPDLKGSPLVRTTGTQAASTFEKSIPVKQSTQSIQR